MMFDAVHCVPSTPFSQDWLFSKQNQWLQPSLHLIPSSVRSGVYSNIIILFLTHCLHKNLQVHQGQSFDANKPLIKTFNSPLL